MILIKGRRTRARCRRRFRLILIAWEVAVYGFRRGACSSMVLFVIGISRMYRFRKPCTDVPQHILVYERLPSHRLIDEEKKKMNKKGDVYFCQR